MKTKVFMTMAALALMATGCNNEDEMDNWNGEIRLTSGIEVQTRATHNLDESLKNGETVHVWVDDAKTPTSSVTRENLYENNQLTKVEGGALTGGTTMYFPKTGNSVNIFALHTNAPLADNTFPVSQLTHTVATDQKSTTDNYATSDLVYAKSTEVVRTSNTVDLTFNHLLSKVEVILKKGSGATDFLTNLNSLKIMNTKPKAQFTLTKDKPSYGYNAEHQDGILISADGDVTEISIDKDVTTTETDKLNEAIIVPQTLAVATPFIQIKLSAGGVFTYKLESETNFESGKKYTYTITVNQTGLTVTSSITDWTVGGTATGTATMD